MHRSTSEVVGREAELDRVRAFLGRRDELPAALIVEGPAGSGKTTIWQAGVETAAAAGFRVLECRPTGAEVQLANAALTDLFEPHLAGVLPALPKPQRRALEVALLLEDGGSRPPDRRALAAGVLNALRALVGGGPILLAIDDAQWVDGASAEVIEFALRRLGNAPVAVLASRRVASPTAAATTAGLRPERALDRATTRIEVGPLSLGAIHRLLHARTELDPDRRTLPRIHATSGGNPFYALELARALDLARASKSGAAAGEPLALTSSLGELLAERLHGLDDDAREALFVAAAMSQPTTARVAAAMDRPPERVTMALAPAVDTSIVRVARGAIEYAHPLLAAAAYAAMPPASRTDWHDRIAAVATDAETRGRHLALARTGPDAEVANALHAGAEAALGRGAPGVAADLFAEAIDRLPDDTPDHERAGWILEAVPVLQATGAIGRARALVDIAVQRLPPGPAHAEALRLLAELLENEPSAGQQTVELLDRAILEAGPDALRRGWAQLDREMIERATQGLDAALPIARAALASAEESTDPTLQAYAHVRTADLEILLGLGGDDPVRRFARAEALDQVVHVDAEHSAPVALGVCLIRAGRLDEARVRLAAARSRASAEGDEPSFIQVCTFLAELEWLAGSWDAAAAFASEALEVAEQGRHRLRQGSSSDLVALVEASRGDPGRARATAERAIAISEEVDDPGYARYGRQVLAFLDLSLGDARAAAASLDTYAVGREIEGPKRLAFAGDVAEALVQLGDVDRAADLVDDLAARGERLRRRPLVAIADRCRALVLAARGDLDGALRAAAGAVDAFAELGQPFEQARALLVLGEVQRRAKQRRAARETLTRAIESFDRLGAHLWSSGAQAERARIGGRTTVEGLTETELRVAQLVVTGRSNKEVAAALFVSVRAVEANLSRIYAKLGVTSRTELARRL